ncbi:hypothetical protein Mal64_02250 [Pseudobythopirellula maris]|uniref:Uncharacterized protein n=1 Tax=Pseudobythopirellula maris TaxID=2527991 RepID=A0A5C5ZQM7_9BACT|nr:hypothetical protein [Pseudobythopirellula maris]TWT89844.1 hypothetical protein Mal64_02250 [Pseudobythopirellula maris]
MLTVASGISVVRWIGVAASCVLVATTSSATAPAPIDQLRYAEAHANAAWGEPVVKPIEVGRLHYVSDSEAFALTQVCANETACCDASCCDSGCFGSGCCSPCNSGCGCLNIYAGAEATFLSADFESASALRVDATGIVLTPSTVYNENLEHKISVGPRVWLGADNGCWGAQVRYWHLDENHRESNGTTQPIGNIYDASRIQGEIDAHTFDAEVVRRFTNSRSDNRLSFGFRYAKFDIVESTSLDASFLGPQQVAGTTTGERFIEAPGLTFALAGTSGASNTGLRFFYSGRASFLWGDNGAQVLTTATTRNGAGSNTVADSDLVNSDDVIFIGEVQLGLEYRRRLQQSAGTYFVRSSVEYQHWTGDFNGAGATATNAIGLDDVTSTGAVSGPGDIDLIGLTLSTGFIY